MARAKQFASRIAKSLDQKGVIIAHPSSDGPAVLLFDNVKCDHGILREWLQGIHTLLPARTADSNSFNIAEDRRR